MRLVIADTGPINYLVLIGCIDVLPALFEKVTLPSEGEQAAIALAAVLNADLVLMDDRQGVIVARSKGLTVAGTLGILSLAARRGLVDLADSFDRLKRTNFRYLQEIMDALLDQEPE